MTMRSAEHGTPRMAVRRNQSACPGRTPDGRRQGRSPGNRSGNAWRPVEARHPHALVIRWPAHRHWLLQRRWRGADAPVMNILGEVSHPQSEILLIPYDEKRSVFVQRWRFPRGTGFAIACRMVESATGPGELQPLGGVGHDHPPQPEGNRRGGDAGDICVLSTADRDDGGGLAGRTDRVGGRSGGA